MRQLIEFDDIRRGMLIEREDEHAIDGPVRVVEIDLDGGWLDTDADETWFRHDLDTTWTYYQIVPEPSAGPAPSRRPWLVGAAVLAIIVCATCTRKAKP